MLPQLAPKFFVWLSSRLHKRLYACSRWVVENSRVPRSDTLNNETFALLKPSADVRGARRKPSDLLIYCCRSYTFAHYGYHIIIWQKSAPVRRHRGAVSKSYIELILWRLLLRLQEPQLLSLCREPQGREGRKGHPWNLQSGGHIREDLYRRV